MLLQQNHGHDCWHVLTITQISILWKSWNYMWLNWNENEDSDSILNLLSFTETILLLMGFEAFKTSCIAFFCWVQISAWQAVYWTESSGGSSQAIKIYVNGSHISVVQGTEYHFDPWEKSQLWYYDHLFSSIHGAIRKILRLQ